MSRSLTLGILQQVINKPTSLIKYGFLYNGAAAINANMAPTGYRVMSAADWTALYNIFNADTNKDLIVKHWRKNGTPIYAPEYNTSVQPTWYAHAVLYGWNTLLFSALPGGTRSGLNTGVFSGLGTQGYFYKSTGKDSVYFRYNYNTGLSSGSTETYWRQQNAIRCCRDIITGESGIPDGTLMETVLDIDGNVYDTVKIGSLVWFIQNLATTKLNNGTSLTERTTGYGSTSIAQYSKYDNDNANAFFANESESIWNW